MAVDVVTLAICSAWGFGNGSEGVVVFSIHGGTRTVVSNLDLTVYVVGQVFNRPATGVDRCGVALGTIDQVPVLHMLEMTAGRHVIKACGITLVATGTISTQR